MYHPRSVHALQLKESETLRNNSAQFFSDNPVAHARAAAFTGLGLNNLAHEALTEWQAFNLSEIAGRALDQGCNMPGCSHQRTMTRISQ